MFHIKRQEWQRAQPSEAYSGQQAHDLFRTLHPPLSARQVVIDRAKTESCSIIDVSTEHVYGYCL